MWKAAVGLSDEGCCKWNRNEKIESRVETKMQIDSAKGSRDRTQRWTDRRFESFVGTTLWNDDDTTLSTGTTASGWEFRSV